MSSAEDLVRKKISELLIRARHPSDFGNEQSLFLSGLLDSVALIQLVLFLEKEFPRLQLFSFDDVRNIDTFDLLMRRVRENQEA